MSRLLRISWKHGKETAWLSKKSFVARTLFRFQLLYCETREVNLWVVDKGPVTPFFVDLINFLSGIN